MKIIVLYNRKPFSEYLGPGSYAVHIHMIPKEYEAIRKAIDICSKKANEINGVDYEVRTACKEFMNARQVDINKMSGPPNPENLWIVKIGAAIALVLSFGNKEFAGKVCDFLIGVFKEK